MLFFNHRNPIYRFVGYIRTWIYNRLILNMTTGWYRIVLLDIPKGSRVLDVGIGTAGALLAPPNSEMVKSKDLVIVGIDYDDQYIHQAQQAIANAGLNDVITVMPMDLYHLQPSPQSSLSGDINDDNAINSKSRETLFSLPSFHDPSNTVPKSTTQTKNRQSAPSPHNNYFNVVYFSGSFSLLPDWTRALEIAASLLDPQKGGSIYITQTYQTYSSSLWNCGWIKPLLKWATSIDFGQYVTQSQIQRFWHDHVATTTCTNGRSHSWELVRHETIPHNIHNPWQAAYWTCFQVVPITTTTTTTATATASMTQQPQPQPQSPQHHSHS